MEDRPDGTLPVSPRGIEGLLAVSSVALRAAGLSYSGPSPGQQAAIYLLALTIARASDGGAAAGKFLSAAASVLAGTQEQQDALLRRFAAPDAAFLVHGIFGPGVAVEALPERPAGYAQSAADSHHGARGPLPAGSKVPVAGPPAPPFWRSWLAWLAGILTIISPLDRRQTRARLLRKRISDLAQSLALAMPALKTALAGSGEIRRAALRASARIPRPSRTLDVTATLRATVRQGGFLSPRWQRKQALTEYLILVRRVTDADLEYQRVVTLLDELRAQGVVLTVYPYDIDPRHVHDVLSPSQAPLPLADVYQRHPHARLVLVTDARELLNPFTLTPWHWTQELLAWKRRAVITPLQSEDWGAVEARIHYELAFSIASTLEGGLHRLCDLLGGTAPTFIRAESSTRITPAFAVSPSSTLVAEDAPAEEEQTALLLDLQLHLGELGFAWLGVCAFFPAMTPQIALYFWRRLVEVSGDVSAGEFEGTYARLATLPWMRYGYMPEWIRRLVIGSLPPESISLARTLANGVLDEANLTGALPTPPTPTHAYDPGGQTVVLPIRIDPTGHHDGLGVDQLTIELLSEAHDDGINPLFNLTPHRIAEILRQRQEIHQPVTPPAAESATAQPASPVTTASRRSLRELVNDQARRSEPRTGLRVALCIGNGAYHQLPQLESPPRDAQVVADALTAIGFEVAVGTDVQFSVSRDAFINFASRAFGADAAVFYFAGHGIQVDGRLYLLPIDSALLPPVELRDSLSLNEMLEALGERAKQSVFLLDCSSSGIGSPEPQPHIEPPLNSIVVLASEPGGPVRDGGAAESPFAAALVANIARPGVAIHDVLASVRSQVVQATGGSQVPWDISALREPFYFVPGPSREPFSEHSQVPRAPLTYFVSYAWGSTEPGERRQEAATDALFDKLRRDGADIVRDSDTLRFGDSIVSFIEEFSETRRILVLLSDKYLRSPYRMYELYVIWRQLVRGGDSRLPDSLRILRFPDARLSTVEDRLQYAAFWDEERRSRVASTRAGKFFICYRRGDDPASVSALYQQLENAFPHDRLFMDVEGYFKPGDNFVAVLTEQVAACDVMLVVIGPRWQEIVTLRADDPNDFVVIEIAAALDQGKRVIPILVGDSFMPRAEALPESIRGLARRQAVRLRAKTFASDSRNLVSVLRSIDKEDLKRFSTADVELTRRMEQFVPHVAEILAFIADRASPVGIGDIDSLSL
jgi:uncharacterized caspase-like protein